MSNTVRELLDDTRGQMTGGPMLPFATLVVLIVLMIVGLEIVGVLPL